MWKDSFSTVGDTFSTVEGTFNTVEVVQYSGRHNISTVEGIQYRRGIASVLWGE